MTSFDDRQTAFENKFAHDQELKFKIEARTGKIIAKWAAEKLGLNGADADSYIKDAVSSNLEEAGFKDILRKISADFKKKNVEVSDHALEKQLETSIAEAQKSLLNS